MGINCFGGTDEPVSRFHQNNESPQNIFPYKSSNLFIMYLCIYFLIFFFRQSELLSPTKKQHIIVLVTFYFIVSGEVSVYLVKIKEVSITSEMISYHFTSD